nr:PRD domain-containing protein [Klebsiella pneumoniae]
MSLWDALRMNMMISYQELVRTFLSHYKDLEQFTSQHGEFIAMVNHSFQRLKILYNVALPVAEIGYIHDIFELRIEDFS